MNQKEPAFYIAHFNDVYDIDQQTEEPVGGAARFLNLLRSLQNQFQGNILTLFSGDLFSPSTLSNIYKGRQMLYPFKEFNVDVSCFGNHDFDFPLEETEQLTHETQIPWLLSNVTDLRTKKPLGGGLETYVKEVQLLDGSMRKIGFIGLAEQEWLGLIELPDNIIAYEDYTKCTLRLSKFLREQEKCQLIIALTHMRHHNDIKLIDSLPSGTLDFVLGGHDHVWYYEKISETFYIKSGTNFKNLGLIKVSFSAQHYDWQMTLKSQIEGLRTKEDPVLINENQKTGIIHEPEYYQIKNSQFDYRLDITLLRFNISSLVKENQFMADYVHEKTKMFLQEQKRVLGFSEVELETRFSKVRTQETNFSNFFCDLIRADFECDVALINSGAIRADELIQAGEINYQKLQRVLAIPDFIVMFKCSGEFLHKLLENGASTLPTFDGRFLGVSGIKYIINKSQHPGKRIRKENIYVNGQLLDYTKYYTVATKQFVASGMDGFQQVNEKDLIIDKSAEYMCLSTTIQFFELANRIKNQKDDMSRLKYEKIKHLVKETRVIDGQQYFVIAPQIDHRIQILE